MPDCKVVDTNVLIVASAANAPELFYPDATPVEEADLRLQVLEWLKGFESDGSRHLVLDWGWTIMDEYRNKLDEQDYGILVALHKQTHQQVCWVNFPQDPNGDAQLPPDIAAAVTDLADRKMVAAALDAIEQSGNCALVNACDTDWLDCQEAVTSAGITIENLIEPWLRHKWAAKKARAGG